MNNAKEVGSGNKTVLEGLVQGCSDSAVLGLGFMERGLGMPAAAASAVQGAVLSLYESKKSDGEDPEKLAQRKKDMAFNVAKAALSAVPFVGPVISGADFVNKVNQALPENFVEANIQKAVTAIDGNPACKALVEMFTAPHRNKPWVLTASHVATIEAHEARR